VARVAGFKSLRIPNVPSADTNTLINPLFAAVRKRNRSTAVPDARFTFTLTHA
jgi:hypothetical protein